MTLRISNALAKAAADRVTALLDAGSGAAKLRLYTGSQPAGGPDAAASGTLLATITLNDPSFGAAADADPGGIITADVDPVPSGTGVADGTAGWGRFLDSDNNPVADGAIGAEITIDNASIVTGQTVNLTAATFTMPEA